MEKTSIPGLKFIWESAIDESIFMEQGMSKHQTLLSLCLEHNQDVAIKVPEDDYLKTNASILRYCLASESCFHISLAGCSFEQIIESLFKQTKRELGRELNVASVNGGLDLFVDTLDALNQLLKIVDKSINMAVFGFDEIVKFRQYKLPDKLRSVMQHHEKITYILVVEDRAFNSIFESHASPFLHFAQTVEWLDD